MMTSTVSRCKYLNARIPFSPLNQRTKSVDGEGAITFFWMRINGGMYFITRKKEQKKKGASEFTALLMSVNVKSAIKDQQTAAVSWFTFFLQNRFNKRPKAMDERGEKYNLQKNIT